LKYYSLAAKNGSFEMCEILIDTIKHLLFQNNKNFFMKQYVSLFLKKNIDKRTPIHEAAKTGNFHMLDFFFRIIDNENGIHEDEQNQLVLCEDSDDELKTSLHLAAVEGKIKLRKKKDRENFFSKGHYEIVQLLLNRGANVCSCDMNDSTPLHEAAAHNHYHCVEILLHHQAPINQLDGKHYTPLHRASQYGHWKIVRLLLNYNADVCLINCDGYNSLEVAILNNHQSTVHEFLRHKTWTKSLRNAQVQMIAERNSGKYEDLSTPLRKLIRYMPNEADEVLTQCMIEIGGSEDYSYKIIFNYEFLEDQLSIFKWKQGRSSIKIADKILQNSF
jgi:ankyrin repeat protein